MHLYKSIILFILLLVSNSSNLAFRYAFFLFLKCLLASHLTLFNLSTLLSHGHCTRYILSYFLSSTKPKHSSSNHGLCCFSSCRLRLSLAEVLIFYLTSKALNMPSPSLKFAEAANLFVISM